MKSIGVIGGLSWVSTLKYYRRLNELANEALGGNNAATLLLYSINTALTEDCIARGDWSSAGKILADAGKSLKNGGANFLIIASNTMHHCASDVEDATGLPLLHIADATAQTLKKANIETVGLLATKATMDGDFYKEKLKDNGFNVLIPSHEDKDFIDESIFRELCRDIINQQTRNRYFNIVEKLKQNGAEGIILGCTEIGLLLSQDDIPSIRVFDTTEIHCQAAISHALGKAPNFDARPESKP